MTIDQGQYAFLLGQGKTPAEAVAICLQNPPAPTPTDGQQTPATAVPVPANLGEALVAAGRQHLAATKPGILGRSSASIAAAAISALNGR